MCQEVTKHQLPSRQILWELAWSNYFNSFCLCWWPSQFGWWRGRREIRKIVPAQSILATVCLCSHSTTRVITRRDTLCWSTWYDQVFYIVPRWPKQPRNTFTGASRELLHFLKLLVLQHGIVQHPRFCRQNQLFVSGKWEEGVPMIKR